MQRVGPAVNASCSTRSPRMRSRWTPWCSRCRLRYSGLTGPVPRAVFALIRTCRLGVFGQVAPSWSSQASSVWWDSSPSRWACLVMVIRRLDRSRSSKVRRRMAVARAAWTAARATISRCAGVTAIRWTARTSASVIGSRLRGMSSVLRRVVGSAKIRPRFLAKRSSERSAAMALRRCHPRRGDSAAVTSVTVISRR